MTAPNRRLKITLIGAGSTVFTRNLLGDLLSYPELAGAEIALHDIDAHRLGLSEQVAHRIAGALGVSPVITASTDRRAALDGARFVLNTIQVGGYKPSTVTDFEIPKKYGLEQTIGDTLGIGGIMRGLRTIPVQLAMLKDMEDVCAEGAIHLNYVNPMAMITNVMIAASQAKRLTPDRFTAGEYSLPVSRLYASSSEFTFWIWLLVLARGGGWGEDLLAIRR